MDLIPTDSKDVRVRVHVRVRDMDGDELVVYEDVDTLQQGAERRLHALLSDHPLEDYPEGALVATFSPPGLQSSHVRAPEVVREDPYPRNVRLMNFPPSEGQLCPW